jgi:hypothetical protein
VSPREQDAVDELDALERPGGDENLVGRAGNAGVAPELPDQEFAQPPVAERSALEAVGRERLALTPEHRGRSCDQARDRDLRGIVVAADEIVFRESVPLDGRRRQSAGQQRREVERRGSRRSGGLVHALSRLRFQSQDFKA